MVKTQGPSLLSKIRQFYLYAVSIIALVIIIISSIGLLNLFLTEYVLDVKGYEEIDSEVGVKNRYGECGDEALFYKPNSSGLFVMDTTISEQEKAKKRLECQESVRLRGELQHANNVKRDLATYISMLIIALPLYLAHWRLARKEK